MVIKVATVSVAVDSKYRTNELNSNALRLPICFSVTKTRSMVNGSLEFTSSISAIVDLTILLLEIRGFFSIF